VQWLAAVLGFFLLLAPPDDGVLRVYLARHGQTDWNRDRRLQGSADILLNDTGRQQAARLANQLRDVRFDAVYSSELKRSRETAEIVHGTAPLFALAGLNERRLGAFEGHASSPEYERRSQAPDDALDGGESLSQFYARVQSTLAVLLQGRRSGAILIVGHGGTNQMIVRALFGLSAERAAAFNQGNDDLYLCEIVSGAATRFWKLTDPAR
jgi:broad specificity phosphatase PhoE